MPRDGVRARTQLGPPDLCSMLCIMVSTFHEQGTPRAAVPVGCRGDSEEGVGRQEHSGNPPSAGERGTVEDGTEARKVFAGDSSGRRKQQREWVLSYSPFKGTVPAGNYIFHFSPDPPNRNICGPAPGPSYEFFPLFSGLLTTVSFSLPHSTEAGSLREVTVCALFGNDHKSGFFFFWRWLENRGGRRVGTDTSKGNKELLSEASGMRYTREWKWSGTSGGFH